MDSSGARVAREIETSSEWEKAELGAHEINRRQKAVTKELDRIDIHVSEQTIADIVSAIVDARWVRPTDMVKAENKQYLNGILQMAAQILIAAIAGQGNDKSLTRIGAERLLRERTL